MPNTPHTATPANVPESKISMAPVTTPTVTSDTTPGAAIPATTLLMPSATTHTVTSDATPKISEKTWSDLAMSVIVAFLHIISFGIFCQCPDITEGMSVYERNQLAQQHVHNRDMKLLHLATLIVLLTTSVLALSIANR